MGRAKLTRDAAQVSRLKEEVEAGLGGWLGELQNKVTDALLQTDVDKRLEIIESMHFTTLRLHEVAGKVQALRYALLTLVGERGDG